MRRFRASRSSPNPSVDGGRLPSRYVDIMSSSAQDLARRVTNAFAEIVGEAPAGVWSAPGRVNLIGEHTDYNAGLCLPIALPHRTYAAAAGRADGVLSVTSLAEGLGGEPTVVPVAEISWERPGGWAGYVAGVLWALREEGYAVGGLDLVIDSSVPIGAGLSSSAALSCAVAAAVSDIYSLDLLGHEDSRKVLAQAAVRAENDIVGAPTGGMDQTVALLAEEGHALRLDFRSGDTRAVPLDLDAAGLELLVCDTRASRALADGRYAERRASCEQAAQVLRVATLREITIADLSEALDRLDEVDARRVRHVVTENARVEDCVDAFSRHEFAEVGRLFVASHTSLRDDFEVSCPELDAAVEEALAVGALGARMTGGGFGGSAIALLPADLVESATAAIEARFDREGWQAPDCFSVRPAAGAGRDL